MVQSTHDNPTSMISLALEHLNPEVFDAMPFGLSIYSVVDEGADFIVEAMNPAATALSQVDVEAVIGRSLIDAFPGAEEMGFVEALRRVWRTGEDEHLPPMRYQDAVRDETWFVNWLVLLTPSQIMAVFQDVTPQILAEHARDAAQQRYSLLTEAMTDGIWDWNVATGELYLSPRWQSQLGYPEGVLEHNISTWSDLLEPSMREAVLQDLQACLTGDSALWEREFQLRQADGTYRWLHSRGTIVRDESGNATRIIGVHMDIEASRETAIELERQTRLVKAVFEAVPDIFMVIDDQDRIIDYHTQEPDLLYLAAEEFLNRRVGDLMPDAVYQKYEAAKREAIAEDRMASYTFPLTTSGKARFFETRLRSLGEGEGFSVVTRDITEARALQDAQLQRVKELSGLYFIQQASQSSEDFASFAAVVVHEVVNAMNDPDSVKVTLQVDDSHYDAGCSKADGECVVKAVDDGRHPRGQLIVQFAAAEAPLDEEVDYINGVSKIVSLWLRTDSARHESELYRRIVSSTQDQVALLDALGRYRVVNRAYAERVRQSPEALVGVEAAQILGETHWQENLQKEFKAALGGEIRNFQEWRDTPRGRRFFNVIYSPLREHGTITGVVVSAHDITELDDARMRLRRAARVFSDSS
ncbi:MAG: PAS domain-containing protein, partial [Halieaceae bacterium]|nr:PAS domain-containing protein [Halieaceae bacterium]